MAICVAADLSQLVLHRIKVRQKAVLRSGVVGQRAGNWPVLRDQGSLQVQGSTDCTVIYPFHFGLLNRLSSV